jgi:DNA-3-methyladenine glycosylase
MTKKLNFSFYNRKTQKVAQELLGKQLVHINSKGQRLAGIIVEVEAYLGIKDAAAHTFGGRKTPRNEVMWGKGGFAYVYFIYGMHYCINAVTRSTGQPEAVLLRALQCTDGLEIIKKNRKILKDSKNQINYANGPGKLCQALEIDRSLNGASLMGKFLFIEDVGYQVPKAMIVKAARIGVEYSGKSALLPLRYYIKNNIYVSKL